MVETKPLRLDSVDILRGVAMVVMALDHVRDYFHWARFDPLNLAYTTPWLFATRWITHHCAPTFVFLAGTGAFLSLARGKSREQLSRFLLTRGLWLVFLELTVVRFLWLFNLDYAITIAQVIWAIGWSMVCLSALVFLPRWALTLICLGMIGIHNAFDGIQASDFGSFGWMWQILHVFSFIPLSPGHVFIAAYPLVPWVGVMGAGYLFGALLELPDEQRRKTLYALGFGLIAGFFALRALNLYGDPNRGMSRIRR
jgi:uncharacterized membrane protein